MDKTVELGRIKIIEFIRMNLGLFRWSLFRHKYLFLSFTIIQVVFVLAVLFGFSLLIGVLDEREQERMTIGALQLAATAVGCTICGQLVSQSIDEGVLEYQKNLPVPRPSILLNDFLVWTLVSIPGIIAGCIVGVCSFDLEIQISFYTILLFLLCCLSAISIGFFIALCLPSGGVTVVGQLIMFIVMLFTPILYPRERLPSFLVQIQEFLPFLPLNDLLQTYVFGIDNANVVQDVLIVLYWLLICCIGSIWALSKRR